ncbi:MAG TPA: FG-GAP-like repeat-containing protein [Candidatus Sulfotelmatobacter sp.]|nr:FG-GAP-like repeat-containing protein [Candidatus Sulfotelmatobacter sp.]
MAAACQFCTPTLGWAQFETRSIEPVAPYYGAFSIATGDFNRDGRLDVVVAGDSGFTVSLGNGDGTFRSPMFYPTQLSDSLAVGDFNNDGNPDIVVGNLTEPFSVSVYLGNGDGTFKSPINSGTTAGVYFVAVGDFNHDKNLDIAIIDNPYVSILLGNGDGTFRAPSDNDSFEIPAWIALGDFNNDGNLDVIVTGSEGANYDMGVLLGNGNGTLQNSVTYPLEYVPATIAAADLRGNGDMDAILAYDLSGMAVFLGNGDGSFQPAMNYDTGGFSGGPIWAVDLNKKGEQDLAIAGGPSAGVDVFWSNGDGTFQPAQSFASGYSGFLAVGDLNGDHLPDFVMANGDYGIISMLNTGVVSFAPTTAPLNFPAQLINTVSQEQSVNLTNNGTATLSISSIKLSGPFQMKTTCGSSVLAGKSCTISATFKPKSTGTFSGVVTIIDSASTKPQFVDLTGSATAVKVSPGSLKFGKQKVGTKSAPQTVTATNQGSTSIQFSNIYTGGADSRDFAQTNTCTGEIGPGASCEFTVTFDPLKTGSRSATLYLNLPLGSTSPAPVPLTGNGT